MAGMIRKASPSSIVLPLALRIIGSNSTTLNCTISTSPQSLNQSQYFSCVAIEDKDLVDLRKFLKHEIKSIKFNLKNSHVNALPDSFPYKKIYDYRSSWDYNPRSLVLQRKFILNDVDTETITLEIDMTEIESTEDDKERDWSNKDIKASAIPISIEVEKPGTNYNIHIKISASIDDIIIQSFYITNEDGKGPVYGPVNGPKFEELDNELQQYLYKYLEIRDIKSNIVTFLLKYIAVKNKRNYLQVLKDLVEFIKN